MEWIKDIAIAVTTGVLAIAGVVIGAKISGNEERKQKRRENLAKTYAELFAGFLTYVQKKDADSYRSLAVSCETLRLICSKESDQITTKLLLEISKPDGDIALAYKLVDALMDSAKKDLRK